MTGPHLTIGWLYPELMSTYGDRGNVICLTRRCEWRGIGAQVVAMDQRTSVDEWQAVDLIVGGGAQDRQQEIVMRDLRGAKADALRALVNRDVPGVFTCGSPQLLGHYYEPMQGQRIEGLGIFDMVSVHPGAGARRCIGNLAFEIVAPRLVRELAETRAGAPPFVVVGFENHGGRTRLDHVDPLGRVLKGFGNNGEDGTEGAFFHNAIATYSHGPLLPKNPFLADWLIRTALLKKYGSPAMLSALDDHLAVAARRVMFHRLGVAVPGSPEVAAGLGPISST